MSILDLFRGTKSLPNISPMFTGTTGVQTGIRSPWSTTQLSQVVLADIYGSTDLPVTRSEAMSVPAIAKARHLICSPLARQPLRMFNGAELDESQPSWLYRTGTQMPPQMRMMWTLDDCLFTGWSLWAASRTMGGSITDAARVPPHQWAFDAEGYVLVDGKGVDDEEVILIPGPFEGLLEAARTTIRGGRRIEAAWVGRVESPIPAIDLHQTTDDELTRDEIDEMLDAWADARSDPRGAVSYSPYNIQVNALGTSDAALFIEGRNAIRLDVANFTGLPGALLDGSTATASLTYSTQEGRRNEFVDYSLAMWMTPIEARLSMDDVCPPTRRIAWDLENLTTTAQPTTGPATED